MSASPYVSFVNVRTLMPRPLVIYVNIHTITMYINVQNNINKLLSKGDGEGHEEGRAVGAHE